MGSRERRHKQLHKSVRQVMITFDPTGLFAMGAPLNECDWAVARIISMLEELDGPAMLAKRLKNILGDMLGMNPDLNANTLREMSIPIWEAWEEYSLTE